MLADRSPDRWRRVARGALLALLVPVGALAVLWISLPDPGVWSRASPTTTALVEQRRAEARAAGRPYRPTMTWVPLERISPRLAEAVVASEDARFFGHAGFDWESLREALRHNLARGRYARGASTISQQLAKNLWLGTEKSLLRKAREAILTVKLERRLDKRRILALYLNVAEWGDGVFGAEAGARRHFSTGAGSLSTAQAVLLASMLPAPRRAALAPAPAWLAARARGLLERLRDERGLPPDEYAQARGELEGYLGTSPVPVAGQEPPEPPPDEPPPDEPPPDEPPDEPAAAAPPAVGGEPQRAEPPAPPQPQPEPSPEPSPEPPSPEASPPEPSAPLPPAPEPGAPSRAVP